MNTAFDTTDLSAPANTPFVIRFDNRETPGHTCDVVGCSHNVAIEDGQDLIFDPLPTIGPGAHADYVIPQGLAPGTYEFRCIIHPVMHGTLTIH